MIKETVNGLEHIVKFRPAYHKVEEGYGVHGMELWFIVKGPKGVVHFGLYTGMELKKTREWHKAMNHPGTGDMFSIGVDVGYHSPVLMYEGQQVVWPTKMVKKNPDLKDIEPDASHKDSMEYFSNIDFVKIGDAPPVCEWLGVPCYCDGSAMRADDYMDVLLEKGDDPIWAMLEEDYHVQFDNDEKDIATKG